LINLHSDANVLSDATLLLHGVVAIKHDNVTGATIYTRTTDDKVAKFITDLAVDAKIKPVSDDLSAHKTAYGLKMTELENADTANANAISAETQARISADTALDGRLTKVENLLGDTETEGSILDRLDDVEAVASANTAAIAEEARVRAEEDGKINTELENHDNRITSAQTTASQGVADAAAALAYAKQVETDYKAADTAMDAAYKAADARLLGASGDATSAVTIWGVKNAAAAAQKSADDANDAVEDLDAVTVKGGEIVGVGAEGKSTIVGTFANNKLTFDFGQLVIDCGTF
jgi:hypothetical protein